MQVLDERGVPDRDLEPDIAQQDLVALYRAMTLARAADERMLKLQRQGRLGTFPPCFGQEAAVCGPALAMEQTDWLAGSYRELGARLMRGEPLLQTLLYYNGREEGSHYPVEARNLPTQVILGSQLPHAVGIAHAMRYQGDERSAVVAFFGDGASSEGDFHEAMTFAGVWKAPVVFICQNNGWAISTPRNAQTSSGTIAQKALAYDIPTLQVDGNDALAMYRATREALDRARAGEGPTLIEAITYRMKMHTTADDPRRYRSEEEEEAWMERDPLTRFRAYLEQKTGWDDRQEQQLQASVLKEVEEQVRQLEGRGDFDPAAPFDHVLADGGAELEQQRAEFAARLKEEVDHA